MKSPLRFLSSQLLEHCNYIRQELVQDVRQQMELQEIQLKHKFLLCHVGDPIVEQVS